MLNNWQLQGDTNPCSIAVVIPALGEGAQLWATLNSIATNPLPLLHKTVVAVVINSRADSAPSLIKQNLIDLKYLQRHSSNPLSTHQNRPDSDKKLNFAALRLAWVDATSDNRQLPSKNGGVGLARKIGCELMLPQLDKQGVLVQLDADTRVDQQYLGAISSAFASTTCQAAVISYKHQDSASSKERNAIQHYELYMRCHALGLRLAGSPYAYHSIGSTIACSKKAYLKAGGMNCRSAGEDFYFLQQLAKTSGVQRISATVVHPAARISQRTPFGTGQVIHERCTSNSEQLFYAPQCYQLLHRWLKLISNNLDNSGAELLAQARTINSDLACFIEQQNFAAVWQRLSATHRTHQRRLHAFHEWFDALKTLRCIKHLSVCTYPMANASHHVPPLLRMAGLNCGSDVEHWLQVMQEYDGAI
ncbi:MAG: hypothetical protein RBR22_10765 [Desulfuromonas sp.]|nr:hypothetical protein [Desulfuromonas sp.]